MDDRVATGQFNQPRSLSSSDIRTLVEDIAEELAQALLQPGNGQHDQGFALAQAFPVDNRKFISLMSSHIRMN